MNDQFVTAPCADSIKLFTTTLRDILLKIISILPFSVQHKFPAKSIQPLLNGGQKYMTAEFFTRLSSWILIPIAALKGIPLYVLASAMSATFPKWQ